ncbi:MAG TPA: phosphopantetheine-binding protein [Burkholderiales bacterium]|nr:phosphopantetheine-binding protein [Burkholderiales bacterium]
MTNAALIVERLGAVFTRTFHVAAPSPDTDLAESGILDPFQFVELLLKVEAHFNLRFRIDDFSLEELRTLAGIARLVATHGGARQVAHLRALH